MSDAGSDLQRWEALKQRLFEQNRFTIKLGLERMRAALEAEGHPERCAPAIVVAGTNGKGTVASSLSAILGAHGLRVGLYTSPHLVGFEERFRVGGVPLTPAQVMPVLEDVYARYGDVSHVGEDALTFFELTTLMAARLFEAQRVDVAIYEVGLGGRLDAVNAIEPALSIITTIDRDHEAYLGDTLEAIAGEKAGVMRAGVPVVIGEQEHSEAFEVLWARASEGSRYAPTLAWDAGQVTHEGRSRVARRHHVTARCAAQVFLGEAYNENVAQRGLERWQWPGRMERRRIVGSDGRVNDLLLDAAHNPAGIAALRSELGAGSTGEVGAVVWGALEDKKQEGLEALLSELGVGVWAVRIATPRALDEAGLRARVPELHLRGVGDAGWCLREAMASCKAGKTVLCFGSIYLLGELYEALGLGAADMVTERAVAGD
ncbi:bifunctional folylpolyglutamate synthase/dihydrofolate synthase [Lujinxingia vulgaris]|uniref:tetrahydrofolate synthase n=1 Tax=Lujinxingia vulgaris TaxID=2600176 RepID=A0A5C6XDD8_9DELT|nr:Mur ligase family protein [Lujinxingia vulgaris]TXD37791.1 bifunctional folylpolyglutamate synthase/dihydrofolate synthase [Lujinxingia vulgaris]